MALHTLRRTAPLALGLGLGIAFGRVAYRAAYVSRLMLAGARQPLEGTPNDLGLPVQTVTFPASDGITLRGWFVPRAGDNGDRAPTVVFVHGWPWNRAGNRAANTRLPDRNVDLLGPARALHNAGFHVLLFDLRNHGASDAAPPVSFGVYEANDVVGAVEMLRARADVDGERIGLLGYSMGANAALYAVPRAAPIRAAVVVQPVRGATFAANFARSYLGAVGSLASRFVLPLYESFGGPPLTEIDPVKAAPELGDTEVLYIQGGGDPWGTLNDVQEMVAATPRARPLVIASGEGRYSGYLYVNQHIDNIVQFFEEELGTGG